MAYAVGQYTLPMLMVHDHKYKHCSTTVKTICTTNQEQIEIVKRGSQLMCNELCASSQVTPTTVVVIHKRDHC